MLLLLCTGSSFYYLILYFLWLKQHQKRVCSAADVLSCIYIYFLEQISIRSKIFGLSILPVVKLIYVEACLGFTLGKWDHLGRVVVKKGDYC